MHRLPTKHQEQLDQLPRYYWWHRHRIDVIFCLAHRFLNKKEKPLHFVDVGGGTGATTIEIAKKLHKHGYLNLSQEQITCIEGDPSLGAAHSAQPIKFIIRDIEKEGSLEPNKYNFFTLLDVAEHLKDPVQLLTLIRIQLKPGSLGVVTVPAYNFLFSEWDRKLGHLRRYTRAKLNEECVKAGFKILWSSYFFSFALPMAILFRKIINRNQNDETQFPSLPKWLNALLLFVGFIELQIFQKVPLPFGTSVVTLVQAPVLYEESR